MSRCAVCHDDDDGTLVACPGCRTLGHADCTKLKCPTIGCTGRQAESIHFSNPTERRRRPSERPIPFGGFIGLLSFFFVIIWSADHFSRPEPTPTVSPLYIAEPKTLTKGPEDGDLIIGPGQGVLAIASSTIYNYSDSAWHAVAIIDTATGIPTRTTCQGRKTLSTVSGTSTVFAEVTVPDDCGVGGVAFFEIELKSETAGTLGPGSSILSPQTNVNVLNGAFDWNAFNRRGCVCTSTTNNHEVSSCSLGTISTSAVTTVSGKQVQLRITPTWTGYTPPGVTLYWRVETPMPVVVEPK